MAVKNKKQFGIWMDSHHATIVGRTDDETEEFSVLGHVKNDASTENSSEKNAHNAERTLQQKFFKEICAFMQNIDELHVTGTGQAQEQFIHYLAETPQYKNVVAKESTANKMSDEKVVEYISAQFS